MAAALDCPPAHLRITAVTGDAGSRRYYRVQRTDDMRDTARTHIAVVDADAAQQECFLRVRTLFAAAGVRVPQVQAQAAEYLLLEDFGDTIYQRYLPAQAQVLYTAAIDTLVQFQCDAALAAALPPYDVARLQEEMQLFEDWYCRVHLARPLSPAAQRTLQQVRDTLATTMAAAAPVAVHRDYHCRNLMWLDGEVGVLDFQDAVSGEPLYDVVSLLRDAYVEWPAAQQEQWLEQYWRSARAAGVPAGESLSECQTRFNLAGAQRGLKVLGIFARLHHRDGKSDYLADLPRVYRHLSAACAAVPALAPLQQLLADTPPQ